MTPTHCPACEADLRYRDRDANGEEYEDSAVVSVVDMSDAGLCHKWRCPECQHTWSDDAD